MFVMDLSKFGVLSIRGVGVFETPDVLEEQSEGTGEDFPIIEELDGRTRTFVFLFHEERVAD